MEIKDKMQEMRQLYIQKGMNAVMERHKETLEIIVIMSHLAEIEEFLTALKREADNNKRVIEPAYMRLIEYFGL